MNTLQQAMRDNHSFQCGFCAPGILMQATELMNENRMISESDIRVALRGNLCRCTGYESIVDGVIAACRLASGSGDFETPENGREAS